MKTRVERKSTRRTDRKTSRRTAGRSPGKGSRDTTIRRPRRSGSRGSGKTAAATAAPAGPREEITAVVEGLVSYEDFDREEREGAQQLLTGDLTNLQQWTEVRAPGKPWLAVALGMACAAIVELRGSRS